MSLDRRKFLRGAVAASAASVLPINWVFAGNMPAGVAPLDVKALTWVRAEDLPGYYTVLNSKPLNAYPAPHMLDDPITPAGVPFYRWNGHLPEFESIDPDTWTFVVDGESVETPKTYTIKELKEKFKHHTLNLTLECGGNGRRNFHPGAKGNQWADTAVYCAQWTGVLVSDVLKDCGVKDDAVYTGHHGADVHMSGSGAAISRGVPIEFAMNDSALIAWAMNGEDIPYLNGFPLRIIYGGRPGSVSQKCIKGMSVRNQKHDGQKMAAPAYSVPKFPVAPGEKVEKKDFETIEEMIVKSLITFPKTGTVLTQGKPMEVRGHAWAGLKEVVKVEVSFDFGRHWQTAELTKPVNVAAWQQWKTVIELPEQGYYEVWARATDSNGDTQPLVQPEWNPKGYMFNGCHRIAVRVV